MNSTDSKEWTAIFDQVLFPLVLRLLKPEVYHSDPVGMSETRVQAAILVCKIFLRYLDQLPNQDSMLELWLKILDILDRMINSGQGDSLVRALMLIILSTHHVQEPLTLIITTGGGNPRKSQEHPISHGRRRVFGTSVPRRRQGIHLDRNQEAPGQVPTRLIQRDLPGHLP